MNVEGQYNPKDVECIPVENLEDGLDYLCQHFAVCAKFFGLYDADCSIENHAPGTSHWRVL